MRVAVAGGTGLIGAMIVAAVRAVGDMPVVLARSTGVDLRSGTGLDRAMTGVDAVIDVSNLATLSKRRAVRFFPSATTNLLRAGEQAGVSHHVVLSVLGCDRVPFGYYLGKRAQERLVHDSALPSTVLRATQFHEFAAQLLARPGPVIVVPRMLSQPVAAREVARELAELARRRPAGAVVEMAGPELLGMPDMVRRLAAACGVRRLTLPVRLPGVTGRAMATGGLLPTEPGPRGQLTFADWLAIQTGGTTAT